MITQIHAERGGSPISLQLTGEDLHVQIDLTELDAREIVTQLNAALERTAPREER